MGRASSVVDGGLGRQVLQGLPWGGALCVCAVCTEAGWGLLACGAGPGSGVTPRCLGSSWAVRK